MEATKHNKIISPYAYEEFEKNKIKACEGGGYNVSRTSRTHAYVKHIRDHSKINLDGYNVDLLNKTCSCQQYQQLGTPCAHVHAFARQHKDIIIEDRTYFHPIHWNDSYEAMLSIDSLCGGVDQYLV